MKNIYSSLNNLNSGKKFTDLIDDTLGYNKSSLKSNLWYNAISDEKIFTSDLKKILDKLESENGDKFISSLFEKFFYAIVKESSTQTISIFHFNFILNLMEQVGVDFLNKSENETNFETKCESQLIGDYVNSRQHFQWDNVWLNKVILVDLMENFTDLEKTRLFTKLGKFKKKKNISMYS